MQMHAESTQSSNKMHSHCRPTRCAGLPVAFLSVCLSVRPFVRYNAACWTFRTVIWNDGRESWLQFLSPQLPDSSSVEASPEGGNDNKLPSSVNAIHYASDTKTLLDISLSIFAQLQHFLPATDFISLLILFFSWVDPLPKKPKAPLIHIGSSGRIIL